MWTIQEGCFIFSICANVEKVIGWKLRLFCNKQKSGNGCQLQNIQQLLKNRNAPTCEVRGLTSFFCSLSKWNSCSWSTLSLLSRKRLFCKMTAASSTNCLGVFATIPIYTETTTHQSYANAYISAHTHPLITSIFNHLYTITCTDIYWFVAT